MLFLYLKALHIIFVVSWFAGLFYNVRLFIYQTEANDKQEPDRTIIKDQLKLMSRRLWNIITWPSAVLTLIFGSGLAYQFFPNPPRWLLIKIGLVLGLYVYHFICFNIHKKLQADKTVYSAQKLRIWNEVATMFLVSVVFLVVLKNTLDMTWGLIGFVLFGIVLMIAVKIYKKFRTKE
ncbi:CopD family protein [Fulvivirgaceae bacterium BMA10]|uniref:Protoporphyrinogen IX oxidase n=1 Tax=Splendidivirga corallicola TaxID=3051826 RepID=A0ABT8KVP8_9BACT|nr:CopD family protein [Fulvivirgaceae bacterium BMA10]